MEFKQYDLDTGRVVMVENPDGAYVLASDVRNLVRRILELEEEVKGLQGRLGAVEYEESRTAANDCSVQSNTNDYSVQSNHVFYR